MGTYHAEEASAMLASEMFHSVTNEPVMHVKSVCCIGSRTSCLHMHHSIHDNLDNAHVKHQAPGMLVQSGLVFRHVLNFSF